MALWINVMVWVAAAILIVGGLLVGARYLLAPKTADSDRFQLLDDVSRRTAFLAVGAGLFLASHLIIAAVAPGGGISVTDPLTWLLAVLAFIYALSAWMSSRAASRIRDKRER